MVNNNIKIDNPKYLRGLEKQLKAAQRQLYAKMKSSNNYRKARLRLAKDHEKIANQRNDFLHKLSTHDKNINSAINIFKEGERLHPVA